MAERSTIAQAMAAGLKLDPPSRDRGHADGCAGRPRAYRDGEDWLAYALGYLDGEAERRATQFERRQPS